MSTSEKALELKAWHLLLEDDAYRLDFPEDFHGTLMARADELKRRHVIGTEEWRTLKDVADSVYTRTMRALDEQRRDCVNTASIDLGGAD